MQRVCVGGFAERKIQLINSRLFVCPPFTDHKHPLIIQLTMATNILHSHDGLGEGDRRTQRASEREAGWMAWICSICEKIKPIGMGTISPFFVKFEGLLRPLHMISAKLTGHNDPRVAAYIGFVAGKRYGEFTCILCPCNQSPIGKSYYYLFGSRLAARIHWGEQQSSSGFQYLVCR